MSDQSLGNWLRRERERRGITLRSISDQTKVALPLLQGLEDDDISRWPGGIFRRSFVRSYATAVGLAPEEILRRFEQEHGGGEAAQPVIAPNQTPPPAKGLAAVPLPAQAAVAVRASGASAPPSRARLLGTAADLTVALVLGLGSAAAGASLLWPVLLLAAYYAAGVLLTGTSPMVALLREDVAPAVAPSVSTSTPAAETVTPEPRLATADRRVPARRPLRVVRTARTPRQRAQ